MGTQNNSPSIFNLKKFLLILIAIILVVILGLIGFICFSYVIGFNAIGFLSLYGVISLSEVCLLFIGGGTIYYYFSSPVNLISKKIKVIFISLFSVISLLFIMIGFFYYFYWINPSISLPDTIQCGGTLYTSDRVTKICNTISQDKYTCEGVKGSPDSGSTCHLKK